MDIFAFLDAFSLVLLVRVLIIILLIVYSVFALLMMRQISAMTKAVQMQDDFLIRGLGVMHFVFAVVVLVLALLVGA